MEAASSSRARRTVSTAERYRGSDDVENRDAEQARDHDRRADGDEPERVPRRPPEVERAGGADREPDESLHRAQRDAGRERLRRPDTAGGERDRDGSARDAEVPRRDRED